MKNTLLLFVLSLLMSSPINAAALVEGVNVLSVQSDWYWTDVLRFRVSDDDPDSPCNNSTLVVRYATVRQMAAITDESSAPDYMNRLFSLLVAAKQSGATINAYGNEPGNCHSVYALTIN